MIVQPGIRRKINSQSALLKRAQMLFTSNNYDGALYIAGERLSLNQLSTGTTPVTAVTDPIGLQLDERFGLALSPELATNGGFDADASWTKGAGWTISGGVASANITTGQLVQPQGLVASKWYKITVDVIGYVSGTLLISVGGVANVSVTANGSYMFLLNSGATGNQFFYLFTNTAFVGSVDNISVRLLDGNHSIQATAAARPTWQVDANGYYYTSQLGTDDCFTSATGGGGTLGFFWCGAIQPTGGAGTLRTLWADNGANTGYKVQLDVNNKLSFSAGNGAAFTTLVSTATVNVGTKYYLTVWDDGTNLNVQINASTAESVGRPVVAAGTAGFTRFKDNGAASSFYIGYEYASDYFKDTGLTAVARADIQRLIRSYAGL